MPNLIVPSFFVGEINIPNVGKQEVTESLNLFISKYEPEILGSLLGYKLYKDLIANPTADRFQKLIYGTEYNDGSLYWRGLIYTGQDPNAKFSLIANFIFWHWSKDKAIWNSGVGSAIPSKNEAIDVSPAIKMNNAWNEGVRQARQMSQYLGFDTTLYPEYSHQYRYYYSDSQYLRTVNEFGI